MSEEQPLPRRTAILLAAAIAYLFWCVFLGGYPFREVLPSFVFSGKAAVAVLFLCILIAQGAFRQMEMHHVAEVLVILAILGIGALLRFHNIPKSAEWGPTIDEPIIVNPVLRMLRTGNLDSATYEYGGVWFYFLLGIYLMATVRMVSTFRYQDPLKIPDHEFYVFGRYATAFLSVFTVAFTYFTARKFFGRLPAIVAAIVLSLSSVSFLNAQQIRLDVSLAMFVLISHYFFLRMLQQPNSLNYFLAGAFTGLAIGTKYTVVSLVAPLFLAHILADGRKNILNWKILLAGVSCAGAFVIFNFFAFANLDVFMNRLPRAIYHSVSPSHWSAAGNRPLLYFGVLLNQGLGALALITAFAALVRAIYKRDTRILLLWFFPILLLATVGSYPSGYPRYLLPVLPVLAILSGIGVQQILDSLKNRFQWEGRKYVMAATVAVLLIAVQPAWNAVGYWTEVSKARDAKSIVDWVKSNVPPGATILVDPTGPILPQDQHKIVTLTYRDFQNPRNLRDAEYICVSEDLFNRIPDYFQVLQEFPAQTKALDRAFRLYVRPEIK